MVGAAWGPVVKPLVVIGAPIFGNVAPEIVEDWLRFIYHCGRRLTEYEFALAIVPKKEQFRARNHIVDAAQQMNADWLLMLDDDMIIDPFCHSGAVGQGAEPYRFLERMLKNDKDICGVLYYQRTGSMAPVLMRKIENSKGYRFLRDDEISRGLQRVDVAGGGCLLVKMRVFDRIKHPFFEPEFEYGTDIQLCRKAADAGFEIWADTSIELGHLRQEPTIVTSRNRHQFIDETLPGEMRTQFVSSEIYRSLIDDAAEWTGWTLSEMTEIAHGFLHHRDEFLSSSHKTDADWYREFPKERVARQVWFNTQSDHKRRMTEYILAAVDHSKPLDILDFGCGIGIPAFVFAQKGHRVTACDIRDTGTLKFLRWRSQKHGVPITFYESDTGVPALGDDRFDCIIAVDCLEHIEEWRWTLRHLVGYLRPGGVLFANNAILDDTTHPEHYDLSGEEFLKECAANGLRPVNPITYVKPVEVHHAEVAHSLP